MPRRLRLFSTVAARSRPPGSGRAAMPVRSADALKDVCERAQAAVPLDDDGARKFFEDNFRPLRINKLGDADGFLTGYYEPIIDGSRVPTGRVHGAALSPAAQSGGFRTAQARRRLPLKGRQSRPPRRPPQDRALLRPRRDRGRRARWLASGNLLAARARSTCCLRRSRARRASGWKTARFCASTTIPITAGPIRRSAGC